MSCNGCQRTICPQENRCCPPVKDGIVQPDPEQDVAMVSYWSVSEEMEINPLHSVQAGN